MKETVVSLQSVESWPLIGGRKVWAIPLGLPYSGLTTLSNRLEESLRFRRYEPDAMETIRAHGRVLRPRNSGYFPSLTEAQWREIMGPLWQSVQKGTSIIIDASHVSRLDRELQTILATWWGYLVVRVHVMTPPNICLKRMREREREQQESETAHRIINGMAARLRTAHNRPSRSEGRWIMLEDVDPLDYLYKLTMI